LPTPSSAPATPAVEHLRAYPPERLFAADSPLIVGTPADGHLTALAERIANAAGDALVYGPKLSGIDPTFVWSPAPMYFLRGWTAWLATPGAATVRADIARAAELAPEDALYGMSAVWIAFQP